MRGPPNLHCLDQPVRVALAQVVPKDNKPRPRDAKLDRRFVRTWVQDCSAERGRPSSDPVVCCQHQVMRFFAGRRSECKLLEAGALTLAQRWSVGDGRDAPLPVHASLTRRRERLGLSIVERFFAPVGARCQRAGLRYNPLR